MKALFPATIILAIALFCVAQNPIDEQPPAGANEKIAEALPSEAYAKPEKPRKLLIFSRTNGYRHPSIPTGKLAFEKLGKETGAFEALISDDLSNFEKENISQFDAICFLNTTKNPFKPSKLELKMMSAEDKKAADIYDVELRESFMNFIKSGGGFIGIHAATDTFYEWPEYGEMIQGQFDGHPWNAGTQVSIKVEPGQESHPLVAMFQGQNIEFKEEIYQHKDPYDSAKVEMLLRLDTEKSPMTSDKINRTDGDFGVSWARNWENGRVFYCSLGHNHEIFWEPKVLQHYLAGIQWALGDLKVELSEGK